eukprot:32578-Rhodomonas_salina.1
MEASCQRRQRRSRHCCSRPRCMHANKSERGHAGFGDSRLAQLGFVGLETGSVVPIGGLSAIALRLSERWGPGVTTQA